MLPFFFGLSDEPFFGQPPERTSLAFGSRPINTASAKAVAIASIAMTGTASRRSGPSHWGHDRQLAGASKISMLNSSGMTAPGRNIGL